MPGPKQPPAGVVVHASARGEQVLEARWSEPRQAGGMLNLPLESCEVAPECSVRPYSAAVEIVQPPRRPNVFALTMCVRLEITEALLGHVSGSRSGVVCVHQWRRFEVEAGAATELWARQQHRLLPCETEAGKAIELPGSGS